MTLQQMLSAAYAAKAMGRGRVDVLLETFRTQAEDAEFRSAAQAELDRLSGIPHEKCIVSSMCADFLREALGS